MQASKYQGDIIQSSPTFPLMSWLVKFKKQVILSCATIFVLATALALYQPVYPVAGAQLNGWNYFFYPKETNPQLRLAGVGTELKGLAVAGNKIWVVGSQGTILHSEDAGNCWRPQGPWVVAKDDSTSTTPVSNDTLSLTSVSDCGKEQSGTERLFSLFPSWASNFPSKLSLFPKANASSDKKPVTKQQYDKELEQQSSQNRIDLAAQKQEYKNEPNEQLIVSSTQNQSSYRRSPISFYDNPFSSGENLPENFVPVLHSVAFADENRGVIVGERGTILLTTDGGQNWSPAKQYSEFDLYSVAFNYDPSTNQNLIVAVGNNGSILISENGGENWRAYKSEQNNNLLNASIDSKGDILIIDYNFRTYQFSWDEESWTASNHENAYELNSAFISHSIQEKSDKVETGSLNSKIISLDLEFGLMVALTQDNQLLVSIDQGTNWQSYASKANLDLIAVKLINNSDAIIVSKQGIVSRFNLATNQWHPLTSNIVPKKGTSTLGYSVSVAPWWYLISLLCAGLILVVIWPRDDGPSPEEGIAGMAASDKPLQPGDPDALNLGKIAADVTSFLSNPKTTAPLTLAITGPWGCGKSSLMNLIRADLKERGFLPVWFNAWHHQKGEQLLASLFAHITQQAIPPWFSFDGVIFRARLVAIRGRRHWFIFALMMFLLFMTWAINDGNTALLSKIQGMNWDQFWAGLFGNSSTAVQSNQTNTGVGIIPMVASLLGIAAPLIAFLKSVRGFGISPEKLVSVDHRNKDQKGYDPGARARFADEFADVTTALGNNKMVIFIDDLDRCSQENLIDILENINFISSSGDCYLLLGMAPKYIEACVANAYETLAQNIAEKERFEESKLLERDQIATVSNKEKHKFSFAHQYLEKMINIEIAIPSMTENSIERLLHQSEQSETEEIDRPMLLRLATSLKPLFTQLHRAMPLIFIVVAIKAGWDYGKSVPPKPAPPPPSLVSLGTIDPESLANLIASHPELAINTDSMPQRDFKLSLEADQKLVSKGLKVASLGNGKDKVNLILSMSDPENNSTVNSERRFRGSQMKTIPSEDNQSRTKESWRNPESESRKNDSIRSEAAASEESETEIDETVIPFRAEERDTTPRRSGSVLLLFILLFSSFSLYIFKRQKQKFSKDSDNFREALNRWTHWIQIKQETPRAIKRFLNHLRYQSIRNRKVISESLLVAYASIAFFEKSWILNDKKFNMICDGNLSELLSLEYQSNYDRKSSSGQWENLAKRMSESLVGVDKKELRDNRQHALSILQSSSLDDVPIST